MINGLSLGVLAFCLFAGAIFFWLRFMNAVALEGRRGLLYVAVLAGLGAGIASLTMNPGWIGGAMATIAVLGGLAWSGLGLLAGQSTQTPNLSLGQPIPAFSAPNETGQVFELESLRGHPVLIKLFRGHW